MSKSLMKITKHENNIINFVKLKYNLKNKNEAISFLIKDYENKQLKIN
ncbi:MAG: hypothetical protein AABW56_01715 [Nanoarchaeota archaeon]